MNELKPEGVTSFGKSMTNVIDYIIDASEIRMSLMRFQLYDGLMVPLNNRVKNKVQYEES